VSAAGPLLEKILPYPECSVGWTMADKPSVFNKDNLFERINGEAEIYFPFGFDLMVSARYINIHDPRVAIDADVYRMGSLLDAFGIYAGYRRADDPQANAGADSALSSSQLLFYQDRYFVRLQATGALEIDKANFTACASAISRNLGANPGIPTELIPFMIPEVEIRSERYTKSLLGYSFLRQGIIADAKSGADQIQVFVVYDETPTAARKTFDQYASYLKTSGQNIENNKKEGTLSLTADEPLYGKLFLKQFGRYIFGAVRFNDLSGTKQIIQKMILRLKPVK
jgi:hypothetical protein